MIIKNRNTRYETSLPLITNDRDNKWSLPLEPMLATKHVYENKIIFNETYFQLNGYNWTAILFQTLRLHIHIHIMLVASKGISEASKSHPRGWCWKWVIMPNAKNKVGCGPSEFENSWSTMILESCLKELVLTEVKNLTMAIIHRSPMLSKTAHSLSNLSTHNTECTEHLWTERPFSTRRLSTFSIHLQQISRAYI